ncbi:hypothetical protein FE257_007626 [Aspergillus nanangensis]|uniref:RNA polymerase II holoenzyme cyclin-like subunit n=1 Tax=Aspergillus nanangensis TaxID=2582783 RepID=A0AAD4GTW9_ASPNN|nr:hypothetical protein FE257_007626 [Aspergillus nanangensis]
MASPVSRPLEKRPVPAPSNAVLLATQAHWLFTDEELTRAPSQLDGMTLDAEHTSRSKGVNFITQVGIMLKLPQLTLATAAVYLHRFFMRYSMVDLPNRPGMHPYPIAATSLFLATKVEENVRRMRELVVACCRVAQKQPNLVVDEQSKEFWKWRDTILHHEDTLLEALCFDLQLEQPYRILYDFICFFSANENKPLRNAAWAFVNDSTFTVLSLQFTARTIAAAALYAAARHCDVAFPDDGSGRPWWEQIDVDLVEVRRACTRMAQLYENNAMQRHSQCYPTTPLMSDEGTEKTRAQYTGSPVGTPQDTDSINGLKRSREPEDEAAPSTSQSLAPPHPPAADASQNGERSPKRLRVDSETAPQGPPAPQHSQSPFSHDRQPTNGHLPRPPHQRYQPPQPYPPANPPYPRGDNDSNPGGGNSGASVDPIQQRIDLIVQQNMAPHGGPPPRDNTRSERRYSDRYRNDREHEDFSQKRRPSNVSASSRRSEEHPPPPPPPQQHQPPPPPPPASSSQPPPPSNPPNNDEEGEGSEEGEL